MGHGPCPFREADVRRAVKAIAATGQPIAGVRFERDGGFTVLIGKSSDVVKANPWDEVLTQDEQH
jgi:hypothetical protein